MNNSKKKSSYSYKKKNNDYRNSDKKQEKSKIYISKNMNYAFQVEYQIRAIKEEKIDNIELINILKKDNVTKWGNNHLNDINASTILKFMTRYPGVLIGTGYPHQTDANVSGEIQVGFCFDYVTGAPYYPGSSLKGILRNVFDSAINENGELYLEYINQIVNEKDENASTITRENIKEFVEDAFGNGERSTDKAYGGTDIFYGGIDVNAQNAILGIDYLAPHKEDTTKNPIVITMLRIMPDVSISFAIDVRGNAVFDKDMRNHLYKRIIEDFGIGAKRNVGYGNLKFVSQQCK